METRSARMGTYIGRKFRLKHAFIEGKIYQAIFQLDKDEALGPHGSWWLYSKRVYVIKE